MRIFKQKPSPAMIVAIAALSVSLVGTAVAGPIAEISLNKGEKKQIRKITRKISNRVSNRRISQRAPGLGVATANFANIANVSNAANTATNAQNAEDAENAENAENAEAVNGNSVESFFYASGPSAAKTQILSLGGLVLTASCPASEVEGIASTATNDALIHSGGTSLGGEGHFYVEDDNFDIGNQFDFLADATTGGDSVQGTLTYTRPNGNVVTAVYQSEQGSLGTTCIISGHATG